MCEATKTRVETRCRCEHVCGNRLLYNGWCHRHQNRRLCSRPHSHESVIFFIFLSFIVFTLRPLCWIYEHACNELMQLMVVVGRIGLCTNACNTFRAARRPLLMTTGKSTTTGVDFEPYSYYNVRVSNAIFNETDHGECSLLTIYSVTWIVQSGGRTTHYRWREVGLLEGHGLTVSIN